MRSLVAGFLVFGFWFLAGAASAQTRNPNSETAAPLPAPAGAPIALAVDASDAPRRIFHVAEKIPVKAGKVTLVYPKWIPGEHGPTGPITDLVGLKISAGGRAVPWRRDTAEMYTFFCEAPAGVSELDLTFDYVAPLSAWTTASAAVAIVNWWSVLLYPQGDNDNATAFSPSLKLPAGWKWGSSLPATKESGDTLDFATVSLVTLIDSPVLAGMYFKTVDLTPGQKPGHWLHIAGDSAASVEIPADDVAHYRRLVAEANALFGARHYTNYHFLLTLSDHIAGNGLEPDQLALGVVVHAAAPVGPLGPPEVEQLRGDRGVEQRAPRASRLVVHRGGRQREVLAVELRRAQPAAAAEHVAVVLGQPLVHPQQAAVERGLVVSGHAVHEAGGAPVLAVPRMGVLV